MRRSTLVALGSVFSIPLLILLLLWQSGEFAVVEHEIQLLKQEQKIYYEKNRRLISQVSVYSSPEVISRIAEERLELIRDKERDVIRIVVVAD